jgi:hypothetical protein
MLEQSLETVMFPNPAESNMSSGTIHVGVPLSTMVAYPAVFGTSVPPTTPSEVNATVHQGQLSACSTGVLTNEPVY